MILHVPMARRISESGVPMVAPAWPNQVPTLPMAGDGQDGEIKGEQRRLASKGWRGNRQTPDG
jgi:hypothetical protein